LINREMKTVTLKSFSSSLDAYGQRTLSTSTSSIDMMIKERQQSNVDDPRYVEAEYIGLTKANVSTNNIINFDSKDYKVLYVTKTNRMNLVFLRLNN